MHTVHTGLTYGVWIAAYANDAYVNDAYVHIIHLYIDYRHAIACMHVALKVHYPACVAREIKFLAVPTVTCICVSGRVKFLALDVSSKPFCWSYMHKSDSG